MTSLADVYQGGGSEGEVQVQRRRLQIGMGLLLAGTVLAIVAIVVATTRLGGGPETYGARQIAGILGGLAAPAILGGAVTVLPASIRLRVAAAIGASLAVLGVATFWHAYPSHWAGHGDQLTPYVAAVYSLGILTLSYCLFAGIATFKRRNDPGGTVSLQIGEGRTEIIEVERPGFGSVGMFGSRPDGEVETQTNSPSGQGVSPTASPASDGGADAELLRSPESKASDEPAVGVKGTTDADRRPKADVTDRYCGNCEYFEYVRTNDGMQPYCGYHGNQMEDMEACEEWSPNR